MKKEKRGFFSWTGKAKDLKRLCQIKKLKK